MTEEAICPRCGRVVDGRAGRCPFDGTETISCGRHPGPGTVLSGRYHLGELIARGGWGMVYRARDLRDGSDVALKVLSPQHARDPVSVRRFLREQRTLARLHHPHVVAPLDHGRTEQGLYIVMELLHGRTLHAHMHRDGPLRPARAALIAAQICDGLGAAHEHGVIHRDLKPDNVFLAEAPADFVKVMDFGIAKLLPGESSDSASSPLVYGTPIYMSPEQACADVIDGRSDLYSLGIVLFEMLTGKLPYPREAALLTMQRRIEHPAPRIDAAFPELGVPGGLCDMVAGLLERDPGLRPDSAAVARNWLAALADELTPTPSAPPVSMHTLRLERLRRAAGGARAAQLLERAALCGERVPAALLRAALDGEGRADLVEVLPDLVHRLVEAGFVHAVPWIDDEALVFCDAAAPAAMARAFEERADTRAAHLAIAEAMLAMPAVPDRVPALYARGVAAHLRRAEALSASPQAPRPLVDPERVGRVWRRLAEVAATRGDGDFAREADAHGERLLVQASHAQAETEVWRHHTRRI
jgi:protein kinase-like protein